MTYARDGGGTVLEFDGKKRRRPYDRAPVREESKAPAKPASILVRAVGAVLRRATWLVKKGTGVESVLAQASFRDDGYAFWISMTRDGVQKVAMFCEDPGYKFKVWPG